MKVRVLRRRNVPELLLSLTSDRQLYHKVGMAAKNVLVLKRKKIYEVYPTLRVLYFYHSVLSTGPSTQPALATVTTRGTPASRPPR